MSKREVVGGRPARPSGGLGVWLSAAPPVTILVFTLVLWGLFTWLAYAWPTKDFVKALALAGAMAGPLGMAFALYVYAKQESEGRQAAEELSERLGGLVEKLEVLEQGLFTDDRSISGMLNRVDETIKDTRALVTRSDATSSSLERKMEDEFRPLVAELTKVRRELAESKREVDNQDIKKVRDLVTGGRGRSTTEICDLTGLTSTRAMDILRHDLRADFSPTQELWRLPVKRDSSDALMDRPQTVDTEEAADV